MQNLLPLLKSHAKNQKFIYSCKNKNNVFATFRSWKKNHKSSGVNKILINEHDMKWYKENISSI